MLLDSISKIALHSRIFAQNNSASPGAAKTGSRRQLRTFGSGVRRPLLDERGLGTLEIVILIAVLLAVALLFNDQIRQFADKLFKAVFNDGKVIQKLN